MSATEDKKPDPNCPLCHGTGRHAPIVAWPAVDEREDKRRRAELPDFVRCGCTRQINASLNRKEGDTPDKPAPAITDADIEALKREEYISSRIIDWLKESPRRSADTAFTAGAVRDMARAIEDALRANADAIVAAERNRCAKIADTAARRAVEHGPLPGDAAAPWLGAAIDDAMKKCAQHIAAAIRNGEK